MRLNFMSDDLIVFKIEKSRFSPIYCRVRRSCEVANACVFLPAFGELFAKRHVAQITYLKYNLP